MHDKHVRDICMCYCIGFAASNISETYDAKIFSVATLLSSYLIYNSVKVRLSYYLFMDSDHCIILVDNRSRGY